MVDLACDGVTLDDVHCQIITDAIEQTLKDHGLKGQVSVLLTTRETIRNMNNTYRNIDRETDVLTFCAHEGEELLGIPDAFLGDIAICVDKAEEQSRVYLHSLERELAFLAVHGTLHLLGYDHMEPVEERVMFDKQDEILDRMGMTR